MSHGAYSRYALGARDTPALNVTKIPGFTTPGKRMAIKNVELKAATPPSKDVTGRIDVFAIPRRSSLRELTR